MDVNNTLVILGSYGLAREFYYHIQDIENSIEHFLFVNDLDDNQHYLELDNHKYKVVKDWNFDKSYKFIVAVGNPKIKKILVDKAIMCGLIPSDTFIHPTSTVQDVKLGKGGVICPGCVITTNIKMEDYVTINLNSTVGHDTKIGKFCTTNPGVHISGNVTIGNFNEFGTGCIVRDGINICDGNTFGAQTAIVSDIKDSGVYIGIPSKQMIVK